MGYFDDADDIRSECDALIAQIAAASDPGEVEETSYEYFDSRELTEFEKQVNSVGKDTERLAEAGNQAIAQVGKMAALAARTSRQANDAGLLAMAIAARIARFEGAGRIPRSAAVSPFKRNPVLDLPFGTQMINERVSLLTYVLKNTTCFQFKYSKNSGAGGVAYECSHTKAGRMLLRDLMDGMPPGRIDPDHPFVVSLIKMNADVLELADRMAAVDFDVPLGSTLAELKEAAME